jgi:acyl-coenzyme A thioesterase PaaI-like protein
MAVFNTLMADSGSNRPKTTAPAAQTATSTKNNNGFFSKLSSAVNNWADKLVGNNPNAGKSGLDNPYNFVRPGREGDIAVTAGGGVPVSSSKPGAVSSSTSQAVSNSANNLVPAKSGSSTPTSTSTPGIGASLVSSINNAVNNLKAGPSATNTGTVSIPATPAIQRQTNTSGTLNNKIGPVNGSSGVITDLPTATQNPGSGTLVGQDLLGHLADITGINSAQGTSGIAESSETAAAAQDKENTARQAEAEQDAAAGLKALLSRWFNNPRASESGLNDASNFVRPGREGDIAVTAGGGSPESIIYPRKALPLVPNQGYDPYAYSNLTPEQAAAADKAKRSAPTIEDRIAEQAAGRQRRAAEAEQKAAQQQKLHEEAMRQQYLDDFVNGKFAGDWNAFNRAIQGSDIADLLDPNPNKNLPIGIGPVYPSLHSEPIDPAAVSGELMNLANKYYAEGGTYSPFGGSTADDVAYTIAAAEDPKNPGTYLSWGNSPLQTTNGQTTDLSGTRTYVAGDPSSYGYATAEGLVPLHGNGLPDNAAASALGALANSGNWVPNGQPAAPESLVQGLATMLANAGVTEESSGNNGGGGGNNGGGGGNNGGNNSGGGSGNSGTYHGGGNVATNNTTGEANDYLYTLPEVSNSVSGALLNRLLPSGYDYNYNARMQSRLGDIQAAEDYYRNSAIPTLQNVYQNQAANTLANYLQAIRANRQSGLTSGANRGAQLASEVQAMQSANKENSENLNNTVGTNLANMLSTLTGKRATAGSDTAGELQPYTTSMDNALSQVLMYYLYGNAAAEVNNGGLRRQNTVNYTAV